MITMKLMKTYDPNIVRECIVTIRNSKDRHEVGTAWAWLERTYGYTAAMVLLDDYDNEQMALGQV